VRVKHYQTVVQVLASTHHNLLFPSASLVQRLLPFLWQPPLLYQRLLLFPSAPPHSRPAPTAAALSFCAVLSPRTSGCCLSLAAAPPLPAVTALSFGNAPLALYHRPLLIILQPPPLSCPICICSFLLRRPLAPSHRPLLFPSVPPHSRPIPSGRCSLVQSRSSRPAASAAALSFGIAHLALSHRPLLIGLDSSSRHCSQVCNGVGYVIGE
jgi:hypothetical protein